MTRYRLSAKADSDFAKLGIELFGARQDRANLIEMHHHLDDIKTQLGCRTLSVGNRDKLEDDATNNDLSSVQPAT